MKTKDIQKNNNNGQGEPTSNRAFIDAGETDKIRGISNSGGQRSDQTSSKSSAHKPEHKKK